MLVVLAKVTVVLMDLASGTWTTFSFGLLLDALFCSVRITLVHPDTPRLVLPGSSSSAVGKLFGCKTMAALAICPAPPTRSDNAKETRMSSNKQAGCKVNSAAQVGKGRSEVHDSTSIEEDVTASLSDEVASASTMEKAIRGLSDVGETDGAAGLVHDRLAAVDEDVDSFIAFLCGKVSTQ